MKSIVKDSAVIIKALKHRFKELGINYAQATEVARSKGIIIDKTSLYKFLKGDKKKIPADEKIIWLCLYYDIPLKLCVGHKQADGSYTLLPYNEERATQLLKAINPKA